MPSVRFATTADLFSSFPTAATEVGEEGSAEDSLRFVRRCAAAEGWDAAIAYCAYLLPRRDAVWWACVCLAKIETLSPTERQCVDLARDWALRPEESKRRRALERGLESSPKLSATWVALAAGWSGGSIAPTDAPPMPPSASATAQAVRVALLSAGPRVAADQRKVIMQNWVKLALTYVETGVDFR
jgi:hypothetical protein